MLLLAHGGPSCLEDVPAFLKMMSGRDPTPGAIQRVTERYRRIGGGSPAPDLAQSIAKKLGRSCGLPVYVGMLHWHPLIEDTMDRMADAQVVRALALCLVPHFSRAGVGKYQHRALAAGRSVGIGVDLVDSWHMEPHYIRAVAESVASALAVPPSGGARQSDPSRLRHVVFTAHSLPMAAVDSTDPYGSQLHETAQMVADRLHLGAGRWTVAYQSAAGPPDKWLGPTVQEVLESLASQGTRQVVVCPFGFVLDQVEILYDLDVALRSRAQELEVDLVRTATLNDSAALVEVLAGRVQEWVAASEEDRRA